MDSVLFLFFDIRHLNYSEPSHSHFKDFESQAFRWKASLLTLICI